MAFPSQFLDEIRNRLALADVVGKRVRLIKKGNEFHGLCPFHEEKTPSFTVNEDKGFYHCFGCGEHGSIFDFVMKTENMAFPEAVTHLAHHLGMEIPVVTHEEKLRLKQAKNLYDVMESATLYFQETLSLPEGAMARKYLTSRGITEDSIKKFRIGFAPNTRDRLRKTLVKDGISEKLLIEAGLLIQPEDPVRSVYDRFRGRIMFPITDRQERVIAFGGRVLDKEEPKYLNSPETALFSKGKNLYALSHAILASRKTNKILVTEGYTDVIALYQAGFKHAVAPLGTALTEGQISLLWKYVNEPILCFDGDSAGKNAARRAAERALPILKPDRSLEFAFMADGEDPDSLIKSRGVDAFEIILQNSVHLFDFVWELNVSISRLETPEDRAGLEKRLERLSLTISDQMVRRYYLNGFKDRLWREFLRKNRTASATGARGHSNDALAGFQLQERSGKNARINALDLQQAILIITLINHPMLFEIIGEQLGGVHFESSDLDKLRIEVLKTLALNSRLDNEALREHLTTAGFKNILNELSSTKVLGHASFARPEEKVEIAQKGWEQTFRLYRRGQLVNDISTVEKELAKNPTIETFELLKALKQQSNQKEDAEVDPSIESQYKSI